MKEVVDYVVTFCMCWEREIASPLFFPPLITYACVNGSFRHVGNRNNMAGHDEGEKNAVENLHKQRKLV